jgi:hypothetical protein
MREPAGNQVTSPKTLDNRRDREYRSLVAPVRQGVTALLRAWSDGDETALVRSTTERNIFRVPLP